MAVFLPSTLSPPPSLLTFPDHTSYSRPLYSNSPAIFTIKKRLLFRCSAKKKISFTDQILDYIEGGPKLRRWYGAPDLLPKDGPTVEDEDEDSVIFEVIFDNAYEDEIRDAVLVTDGDSDIVQMVILSLIVKRSKIKALVKDKRAALEAFGTYVDSLAGDTTDRPFLKRALRGVRTIICPNLSVFKAAGGIQALMKGNAVKRAEKEESTLVASGIPYTIIRAGLLRNTPGGNRGFSFAEGSAAKGSLSKEDAALICVEAVDAVPQTGFSFEVVNGEEKVSDWKECLARLMEKTGQKPQ
ncbi:hypothetical protein L484_002612 [Morus notabilis]|uniref:NAD(P)-binding domain-containing protein n=1 Tax=Morus notabilis TaxID=981085 RepID=W9S286_9ROSA|nr:hypothetical protein L484_002612 [Morus notabilis]